MGIIDAHLDRASVGNRAALERVYAIARESTPDLTEGESYGMPALLYRGKGFVAALESKVHLGLYPFSGKVLPAISDRLDGFDWSQGALKFSANHEIPDDLLRLIFETRREEIDRQLDGRKR
ncbi:Uncharacterized conserved protein YdhG, YjbR/CyaY-like superfamily, DUF1801 family [Agromyces sp. CF514]|uniref:iron chaperone n=1 Tax=Agromyces sp. CF514 TaxID=1881031 RepID=UPI0008E72EDE|nr:DUF1801 domain-containing protein [Agromyces sp. CF514]SFR69739.1 Uncharacterized conserved protein YdhG, YjbR/CyaY-like superfamily, DUF1801 family [Agromyces sp. CF514]